MNIYNKVIYMKNAKLKSIFLDHIQIDKTIQKSIGKITTKIRNLVTSIQRKNDVIKVRHTVYQRCWGRFASRVESMSMFLLLLVKL